MIEKICEYCGYTFEPKEKRPDRQARFCSRECVDKAQKIWDISKEQLSELRKTKTDKEIENEYNLSRGLVSLYALRFGLPRRKSKHKDSNYSLTEEQKCLIDYCMLGDGCMTKVRSESQTPSFWIVHSESQLSLLKWMEINLTPLPCTLDEGVYALPVKSSDGRVIHDGSSGRDSKRFTLRFDAHPFFKEREKQWYLRDSSGNYVLKNGRRVKKVPSDLPILTDLGLLMWFMDDGTNSRKRCDIYTNSFSEEEVDRLVNMLCELEFSNTYKVPDKGDGQFFIRIPANDYLKFISCLRDTARKYELPQEMWYKLGLDDYKVSSHDAYDVLQIKTDDKEILAIQEEARAIPRGSIYKSENKLTANYYGYYLGNFSDDNAGRESAKQTIEEAEELYRSGIREKAAYAALRPAVRNPVESRTKNYVCLYCSGQFSAKMCQELKGGAKYCSIQCRANDKRGVPRTQPLANNTSGIVGVSRKESKWVAKFGRKYLGTFETKEEANDARQAYLTDQGVA